MKSDSAIHTLILLTAAVLLPACIDYCPEGGIIARPQTFECGPVAAGDSAHAVFRVRNASADTVTLTLMPECDCTVLDMKRIILAPHERTRVCAAARIERAGEYVKYIFVQKENSEFFITLSIHGNAISTE